MSDGFSKGPSSAPRPSDVFNGIRVRRRFAGAVLNVIERTTTVHRTFI